MPSIITNKGLALFAKLQAEKKVLNIDKFVYAYIPGLDPEKDVDPNETMPEESQIVHKSSVTKAGYVDPSTVIYSNMLGPEIGDFEFNWIGIYCNEHETLCVIYHQYPQKKWKTRKNFIGNILCKNIGIQYVNIKDLSNITIKAETWQLDLSNRLKGIDNREQAANKDLYGDKYFSLDKKDAFLIYKDGDKYLAKAGVGYVAGIRIENEKASEIGTVDELPVNIYLDVWLDGNYAGVEAKYQYLITDDVIIDYEDDLGQYHYVRTIASIAEAGTITDLREATNGKIHELDNKSNQKLSDNPDLDDPNVGLSTVGSKELNDKIKKNDEKSKIKDAKNTNTIHHAVDEDGVLTSEVNFKVYKVKSLTGSGATDLVNDGKGNYNIKNAKVVNTNGDCKVTAEGYKVDVTNDKKGAYDIKMTHLGNDDHCVFLDHFANDAKGYKDVSKNPIRNKRHNGSPNGSRLNNDTPFGKLGKGSVYTPCTNSSRDASVNYAWFWDFGLAQWTIDFWFNLKALIKNGHHCRFMLGGYHLTPGDMRGWTISQYNGNVSLWVRFPGDRDYSINLGKVDLNGWRHCAIAKDATGLTRGFKHGNLVGTSNMPTAQCTFGDNFMVGGAHVDEHYNDWSADGSFAELRFSTICRYTNNFQVPTAPYGPDYITIYDKKTSSGISILEAQKYNKKDYTYIVPPTYDEFYEMTKDDVWILRSDCRHLAISKIIEYIYNDTKTYMKQLRWVDKKILDIRTIEIPRYGFESEQKALDFIRKIRDVSNEELIKYL